MIVTVQEYDHLFWSGKRFPSLWKRLHFFTRKAICSFFGTLWNASFSESCASIFEPRRCPFFEKIKLYSLKKVRTFALFGFSGQLLFQSLGLDSVYQITPFIESFIICQIQLFSMSDTRRRYLKNLQISSLITRLPTFQYWSQSYMIMMRHFWTFFLEST